MSRPRNDRDLGEEFGETSSQILRPCSMQIRALIILLGVRSSDYLQLLPHRFQSPAAAAVAETCLVRGEARSADPRIPE